MGAIPADTSFVQIHDEAPKPRAAALGTRYRTTARTEYITGSEGEWRFQTVHGMTYAEGTFKVF
jgi:hypothetical protein